MRTFVSVSLVFLFASSVWGQAAPKPVRALLVCGGCCHDYGKQKDIIAKGLAERAHIETTIVHQGGTSTASRIPLYENPNWADGFDIIIHDECFSDAKENGWVSRVLKPHKAGKPGVVLHCAMHSYRDGSNDWFEFCGVVSRRHGVAYPHEVTNADPKHPIMKDFGPEWQNPAGELYWIEKVLPGTHVLASSKNKENGRDEVCVWSHEYQGKARVFGTTLGHHNVTVESDAYLDMLTRGVLWAANRLSPDMLKVEQPKKVRENLAKDRPTKASSEQQGNFKNQAVDGDPGTRWCAKDASPDEWLQVDLGSPQTLTGVKIEWESSTSTYRYKVEGSSDEKSWKTLVDGSKNTKPGATEDDFAANGVRYVRVTFLGANTGNWGSLFELEVLGTNLVTVAPRKPSDALARDIKAPPGYEATVFAAPPMVAYPVFVAASTDGDLYVSVDRNGSLDRALHRGSVVRLRDTDGDGKADESKVFIKDVDSPRGLVWDHDRLYLMHPPHLSVFIDKDKDGVSDEQKILVKNIAFGFKDRPADHTSNGVTLGIDGRLYLAIGDFGFMEAEGTDGRKLQLRGGGVVRVRPDGTGLELYSRGTRNILEVSVDPLLNAFSRDNTNDGGGWDIRLHHFSGLENHGYPSIFRNFTDEAVAPLAIYGGGSGCGGLYLDEPGFPAGDSPALFTADWGREWVFRHHLKPKGATFEPDQSEFLGLPRVTDLDVDGSSRLYAASWKGASFTYVGENVGFVARLTPKGYKPAPLPKYETLSGVELARELRSPSARRRLEAQRTFLRRGIDAEAEKTIKSLCTAASEPLPVRVAALFTLKQARGAKSNPFIATLLADAGMREFSLRALGDRDDQSDGVPIDAIASALGDSNPRVRLAAAVALARLGVTARAEALPPLLKDADPVVAHTAVEALVRLKARDAAFKVVDAETSGATERALAVRVLGRLHDDATVDGVIARLKNGKDATRRAELFAALCRLHDVEGTWRGDSWGTRPDTSGPYYQADPWAATSRIDGAIRVALENADDDELASDLQQLALHKIALVDKYFLFSTRDGLAELTKRASRNPKLVPGLLPLVAKLKTVPPSAEEFLIAVAEKESTPDEARVSALIALVKRGTESATRASLVGLSRSNSGTIGALRQSPAREAFLNADSLKSHEAMLITEAEKKNGKSSVWAEAALVKLSADAKSKAAASIEKGWNDPIRRAQILKGIALAENSAYADRVRAALTDPDKDVASAAGSAAMALRLDRPNGNRQGPTVKSLGPDKTLERIMAVKGTKSMGEMLFTRLNCVNCHTVSAHEAPKGPFLGNIAATYKRKDLAEAILRPSKTLAQGFVTQAFGLDDGSTVVGFVVKESADSVTVRNAEAKDIVIPVKRIEERAKRDISVMPEGLVNELTIREFSSLLDYLEAPNSK